MLSYILRKFAQKTGIACFSYGGVTSDANTRQFAIDFINEASKEIWNANDLSGSIQETTIAAENANQVSIPSFVGSLRALREVETNNEQVWKLSSMRSRYTNNSWADDAINNWLDKGHKAIARDITNEAPLKLTVHAVEVPPITVTIIGSTEHSNRVQEEVILDSTEKMCVNSFVDIESITKDRINLYNILVIDAEERELSIIYNDELNSAFKIVDVSETYTKPTTNEEIYFELLYKKALRDFHNDGDNFPINGYDDVILAKALKLYYEDKQDAIMVVALEAKATKLTNDITNDQAKGKTHKIEFMPHAHSGLFQRKGY